MLYNTPLRQSACLVRRGGHDGIMFANLDFFVEYRGSTSNLPGLLIRVPDSASNWLYFKKKCSSSATTWLWCLLSKWLTNLIANFSCSMSRSNFWKVNKFVQVKTNHKCKCNATQTYLFTSYFRSGNTLYVFKCKPATIYHIVLLRDDFGMRNIQNVKIWSPRQTQSSVLHVVEYQEY